MNINNLDRFSQGFPDPQENRVYDHCAYSGKEIFYGESYLLTKEGDIIRDDLESVVGYFQLHRLWPGEEII